MKRVEASIAAEKKDRIVSALEDLNLQATFYESRVWVMVGENID